MTEKQSLINLAIQEQEFQRLDHKRIKKDVKRNWRVDAKRLSMNTQDLEETRSWTNNRQFLKDYKERTETG
jgi:hypothetical protein